MRPQRACALTPSARGHFPGRSSAAGVRSRVPGLRRGVRPPRRASPPLRDLRDGLPQLRVRGPAASRHGDAGRAAGIRGRLSERAYAPDAGSARAIASRQMTWVELFAVLVVCHMVGDFVLQTNWQATHKRGGLGPDRESMRALTSHVAAYTLTFVPALIWTGDERGAGAAIGVVAAV